VWLLIILATPAIASQAKEELTPEVQNLQTQAIAARELGDSAKAIERYLAIITLAPHFAAAYNNLGMLCFNEHDYTNAVEVFRRCLELDPGMASASAALGMSYFHLGQNAKAEPLLRTVLKANPANNDLEMILSLVLIDLRRDREAAGKRPKFPSGMSVGLRPSMPSWVLQGKREL